ncbi:MAG: hypothetical protein QMC80_02435 [Thermoplasmatales archaeon]|nr:hypothetical protein [Thermoplasmatales archaeon]
MNILMGVGNTLKGDDGIGCWIAKKFKKKTGSSLTAAQAFS